MWYRVLGMGVFYESRVRIQEFIGEFTLRWAPASERQQNEHVGHATKRERGWNANFVGLRELRSSGAIRRLSFVVEQRDSAA